MTRERNEDPNVGGGAAEPTESRKPTVNQSRRRLAGAGISATVLMTLASRNALADHCTVSGMLSGNLSRPDADITCRGRTPGYWKTHPESWPKYTVGPCNILKTSSGECSDYSIATEYELSVAVSDGIITQAEKDAYLYQLTHSPGTPFSHVFGSGIALDGNLTLMQALQLDDPFQPSSLMAHAVAAVLNANFYSYDEFGYTEIDVVNLVRLGISSPDLLMSQLVALNERVA